MLGAGCGAVGAGIGLPSLLRAGVAFPPEPWVSPRTCRVGLNQPFQTREVSKLWGKGPWDARDRDPAPGPLVPT